MSIIATTKKRGRPKNPNDEPPRRGWPVRIRYAYLRSLAVLVSRNGSDLPEEVNIALRERLERAGLWPYTEEPCSDHAPDAPPLES